MPRVPERTGTMAARMAMVLCLSVSAGFLACTSVAADEKLRGTATYRERTPLPPDAILEVSLLDISRADAPATKIGAVRIVNPGTPPFEFEISYDPALIEQNHTYSVRATIRSGDSLMFTTETISPVLTRGAAKSADLLLVRVDTQRPHESSVLTRFPATFEGELPCADCPGIFYHLDLFEDQMFFLRTTSLGRAVGAIHDFIGSWALSSEGGSLTLFGGMEAPLSFRVVDANTLRKLDLEGRDIESALNYDLRRRDDIGTIEPRLTMRGMYRYMADAAIFAECLSGRKFPVSMEADNVALERAYLKAQNEPGKPIMVSLQGRIAARPAMEGDGIQLAVVPEHFLGVWPGETCGARMAESELENTYWKLTRLGNEPVVPGEDRREPHMILRSQDGRVSGFTGCNRLTGGYTLDGSAIEFSQMANTMMTCADGADTERGFTAALGTARLWRLEGHHLELLDEKGDLAARFEARYMN